MNTSQKIKSDINEITSVLENVKNEISSGAFQTITYHCKDEAMELTGKSFYAQSSIEYLFNKIIEYYEKKEKCDMAMCKALLLKIGGFFCDYEFNYYFWWLGEPKSSIEYLLMEALEFTQPKELMGKVYANPQCSVCEDMYTLDIAMRVFVKEKDDFEILLGIECDKYDSQYSGLREIEKTLDRINEIKIREDIDILQYTEKQIYDNYIEISRDIWLRTAKLYKQKYNNSDDQEYQTECSTKTNGIIDRRKPKKPIKSMSAEEVSAHYRLSNNNRILTNVELKFYQNILSSFCDDLQLIPLMKVRVNDIIDINEADSREDYHYRLNVAMLHFDFVLVKPESTEIVCVIELDDASHQKEWTNDDDKNKLCQILNIPLLRVSTCPEQNIKCIEIYNSSCTKDSKHSSIAVSSANVKTPVCKKCGSQMVETPNKKQGVIYWSCPKCYKEKKSSNGSFYIYV